MLDTIFQKAALSPQKTYRYFLKTQRYPDVILATKEKYYGNGSSDKILLGRKAAKDLFGNAPISYFDVDPPYPHQ